jgi:hypothetical protein
MYPGVNVAVHPSAFSVLFGPYGPARAVSFIMIRRTIDAEKLLERATALAIAGRDLEMMNSAMILRGYLVLRQFQPANMSVEEKLDDVVHRLLQAARSNRDWSLLLEAEVPVSEQEGLEAHALVG